MAVRMMGKRAQSFSRGEPFPLFSSHWVEYIALAFTVIGFFVTVFMSSRVIALMTVFIGGMLFGRVFYRTKKDLHTKWQIIAVGFLIGFVLGTLKWNPITTTLVYVLGIYVSYLLHEKGLLKTVEW